MAAPKKSAKPKTAATKKAAAKLRTVSSPSPASEGVRGIDAFAAGEIERRTRQRVEQATVEWARKNPDFTDFSPDEIEGFARDAADAPIYRVRSTGDLCGALRRDYVCAWINREQLKIAAGHSGADSNNLSVTLRPPLEDGARSTLSPWSEQDMFHAHTNQPKVIAEQIYPLLEHGPAAVLDTLADLLSTTDPADLETNTLSWLGNRVSYHLRRAVLLRELENAEWNLSAVAARLRVSSAGNVTKLIGDLGLRDELAKARAAGKARRGVRRG